MLKEINRISRQMLFMHGHLTRPADWAQSADSDPGQVVEVRPAKRRRSALVAAACCVVVPLVNVQIR